MTHGPLGEEKDKSKKAERGKHNSLQGSESGRGEVVKARPIFQKLCIKGSKFSCLYTPDVTQYC